MLTDRFFNALRYAAELHDSQKRKGTEIPYFAHLMSVCSLVLEHGGNEDEAIGALLHDSVEDQGATNGGAEALRREIEKRFGSEVRAIVDGCTDADTIPKPPWRERKEQYLAHIAGAPPSVQIVSCADKLHNARSILLDYREHGSDLWDRFNVSDPEAHLWYYRGLVEAFRASGRAPKPLVDELARTVGELEAEVG